MLWLLPTVVCVVLAGLWLLERGWHARTRQERDVALEFEYAERVRCAELETRLRGRASRLLTLDELLMMRFMPHGQQAPQQMPVPVQAAVRE